MKVQDLKNGEFGVITDGYTKGIIVKRVNNMLIKTKGSDCWGDIRDLTIQVDKLKNVKITYDGYKSEYPKMMNVWDDVEYNNPQTVVGEFQGQFLIKNVSGDSFVVYKNGEDIPIQTELTLEEIAEKFGITVEQLKIKKE